MEITEIYGSSGYQTYLHLALDDAINEFEEIYKEMSKYPPLTEESATPELTMLHYKLEQRRATAIVLAACCVEAVANLYLANKTSPEQFGILEWAKFMDKWIIIPSFFIPNYTFPKNGVLYQDLKRLNTLRNTIVHLKEEVTQAGTVLHRGSQIIPASDEHLFIGRCRTLPEKLLSHVAHYDKTDAIPNVQAIIALKPVMQEMDKLIKRRKNK
jgi:hypothetical protein